MRCSWISPYAWADAVLKANAQVPAIIVTHALVGKELIAAAEYLVGKIEGIEAVSIKSEVNSFDTRKSIAQARKRVDRGDGLLLMTDLSEGLASSIAFSFLVQEKVEVITGVNLPMILTFWNKRQTHTLREIARAVQLSGVRSINRARALREGKKDRKRVISRESKFSS
jgi:PTS system mannose-specific IIA component